MIRSDGFIRSDGLVTMFFEKHPEGPLESSPDYMGVITGSAVNSKAFILACSRSLIPAWLSDINHQFP